MSAVAKKGFNRNCLHLTDTARGIMHALTMNSYGQSTAGTGFSVEICSPANWITRRQEQAKRKYIQLRWEDLTHEDRANVLHIVALPDHTTNLNVNNSTGVDHVVLRHPDGKKRETVVLQPIFKREFGVEDQNNLGGRKEIEGVDAAFVFGSLPSVRDERGEFLVTVVGEHGEKNFKIKQKHLDDLGM